MPNFYIKFRILSAVLLGCLLSILGESPKDATKFYYAAGIIVAFIPASLFTQHSFLGFETIGMLMSSATSALIYRKVSVEKLIILNLSYSCDNFRNLSQVEDFLFPMLNEFSCLGTLDSQFRFDN